MYTRTCLCQYRSIRGLSQIWGAQNRFKREGLTEITNICASLSFIFGPYHDKSLDVGLHGFWSKTIFSEMETKLLKWLSPKCQPQLIAPTRHVDRADCHLACTWLPIVSKQSNRSLTVPSLASRQPGLSNIPHSGQILVERPHIEKKDHTAIWVRGTWTWFHSKSWWVKLTRWCTWILVSQHTPFQLLKLGGFTFWQESATVFWGETISFWTI